jgi:modulator of FtsH protease HflK
MAWNDRNNQGKGKDPWGNGSPPDLDEALRNLQRRLSRFMSGGKGSATADGGPSGGAFFLAVLLGLIVVIWFLSGIFVLGPAEEAVVLRFGRYVKTYGPGGLHWVPRVIEAPYIVNVERVETYSYSAEMLNKDENILSVSLAVQYRIDNARNYLFNVVNPGKSLEQATASALRQVVGHSTLDQVLTYGRQKIREDVSKQLKKILNTYKTGLVVTDIAMQPARAPDQVKSAFDDAIKAQEDEQRFINQAKAYQANEVPIAKGGAKRLLAEAEAYRQQAALRAKGDVARFEALLLPYKQAPRVTRERMYISTLESVFNHTTKVLVDSKGNNSLMYLPIEKMLSRVSGAAPGASIRVPDQVANATPTRQIERLARDRYMSRGGR